MALGLGAYTYDQPHLCTHKTEPRRPRQGKAGEHGGRMLTVIRGFARNTGQRVARSRLPGFSRSLKARLFVKRLSIAVASVALAALTLGGNASAQSKSCEAGNSCQLGAMPAASKFTRGKVNGAAAWQSDGYANLFFTTTTGKVDTYKVAICGAAKVETVQFEGGGRFKDEKVASPKGKLSGCDLYSLQTGRGIDGLRIKPQGNSFKLVVRKNGAAEGYSVFLADAVLAAREGHYHFRMK